MEAETSVKQIDPASKVEFDKQKAAIQAQVALLSILNLNAKGKSGALTTRINSLNETLKDLNVLETSTQVYSLKQISSSIAGGVTLDTKTKNIVISYANTANYVHESKHAAQYESQDIAFDGTTGNVLAQDIFDEVAGYKAQYAFEPTSVSALPSTSGTKVNSINDITPQWIQGLGGGNFYSAGGTTNTAVSPLNMNSNKNDIIKAFPKLNFSSLPNSFIFKNGGFHLYRAGQAAKPQPQDQCAFTTVDVA